MIENASLLRDVQQKSQELEALVKVNRDIASLPDKKTLLTRIAEEVRKVLGMDASIFGLVEGEDLVLAASTDIKLASFRSRLRFGESLSGKIVEENRTIAIRNVFEDDRMIAEHRTPCAVPATPLCQYG